MEAERLYQTGWSQVLDVSGLLKRTADSFDLSDDREWLRHVLREVASGMHSTVMWAAVSNQTAGVPEEGQPGQNLVAADAARSDAVVAKYCLDFMLSEKLIDEGVATYVNGRLTQVETALQALASALRTEE